MTSLLTLLRARSLQIVVIAPLAVRFVRMMSAWFVIAAVSSRFIARMARRMVAVNYVALFSHHLVMGHRGMPLVHSAIVIHGVRTVIILFCSFVALIIVTIVRVLIIGMINDRLLVLNRIVAMV